MKKSVLFFGSLCALFFCQIADASSDSLWISQVQVDGDGGPSDEFVEIFNPTDSAVSLDGWSIQYKSSSSNFPLANSSQKKNLPSTATVPAHGYFLFAGSGYNGSVTADHTQSSISLTGTSTGATIFLVHGVSFIAGGADAAIVDKVAYGSSINNSPEANSATTPPPEKSLQRSADTDNNAVDFFIADANPHNTLVLPVNSPSPTPTPAPNPPPTPVPTPPPAPGPRYSQAIVISEFLPNPDGSDSGEEWVELFNPSNADVDLSDWKLDDQGQAVGSSAYTFPKNSVIKAQGYLVVDLPEGSFTLNNTGGDSVRLIWPDKTIVTEVAYTGNANADQTYAIKPDYNYAWTSIATKGSANKFDQLQTGVLSPAESNIKISEIFPNPKGADSGGEWVELINLGTEPVLIHNWILDDGEKGSAIRGSAWKIQSPIVYPQGFTVLSIPAGKFSLNNTSDTVRLYNSNKVLIDSISYADAKEDLSYSMIEGKWVWASPTPNAANVLLAAEPEPKVLGIAISEVYPEPANSDAEFIELLNTSDQPVKLDGFKVADKSNSYEISNKILAPHDFYVLKKSKTKIALNNFGSETVTLADASGVIVVQITYEDAPKAQSYNLLEDGTYAWSTVPTPGAVNKIVTPVLQKNENKIVKAVDTTAYTEVLPTEIASSQVEAASTVAAGGFEADQGVVSGTGLETPIYGLSRSELWLWLIGSFALNLVFCYSLVKLMLKRSE